jgi:poly(hydroxyalkanoate) depolymerase family esterase
MEMKTASLASLMEATRLTRAGRLAEATAFLHSALQGRPVPHAPDKPAEGLTIEGISRRVTTQENEPPPADLPERPASIFPGALRSLLDPEAIAGRFKPLSGGLSYPAPTEPAVVVPDGAQFLAGTFAGAAGSRPYKLYVPSGYRGQPVPLIVMLHGCTQSPDDFAAGTRMNDAAEAHDCLVLYPGQTSAANTSRCWNWFNAGDQQRDQGEPSLIAGMTREVMRAYSVDPGRVYIAGLSAGGAAAAIMGAAYPDLYAAIGVHSGLPCGAASDLPSAFAAMRQGTGGRGRGRTSPRPGSGGRIVRAIVFHGDQDQTVHPRNGDQVVTQATPAGVVAKCTETGRVPGGHAYSRTLHRSGEGETILEQWVIHGAGHAWAGGSTAGSYTDPSGPDATSEMLRFFLERKPGAGRP